MSTETTNGAPVKTPLIWEDMAAFVAKLTPEQLKMPLIWWGEEEGGRVEHLFQLEEDHVLDDSSYVPRSEYQAEDAEEFDEEDTKVKGTPIISIFA